MTKFIPKVGEECFIFDGLGNVKATPSFVGKEVVVYSDDNGERVSEIKYCSPNKTPDEIEREESAAIIYGGGRLDSADLAKMIIDAGCSKQQIKPLMTRSEFILICESERWANDIYEKVKGLIIQGGDK